MKILGVDFGLNNFGLAITEGRLAEPLGQIKTTNLQMAINSLASTCQKNQIEKIIIGMPSGKLVEKIKKFGRQLEKKINVPVIFQDETLTTEEAVRKMIEADMPLKKRQKQKHVISACIILQSYLDDNLERGN